MSCPKQKLMYQPFPGASLVFVRWHIPTRDDLDLSALEKKTGLRHYLVPCGQCTECRLQRSRETATRIFLEMKTTSDCWGITLTYDDDHLPLGRPIVDDDGVVLVQRPTLSRRDCQLFQKNFRIQMERKFGVKNLRFYLGAEYGDHNARPHYHYIWFNCRLPADQVVFLPREKTPTGEDLFASPFVEDLWGKGRVRLNTVSWQYAAYVARYIMKKQVGKNSHVYDDLGIVPEFTSCSIKPGLGYDYFKAYEGKLLEDDKVLIKRALVCESVPLPKYFLRKAEEEGVDLDDLKMRRQDQAVANARRIQSEISEDYFDFLKKQQNRSEIKKNLLTRSDF